MLDLIRQAFFKTVLSEYKLDKIWWDERDIVGVFYHILRPVVDLIPEHELYWEWYVKFYEGKKGNCRVDLVLVENVTFENNEGDIEKIEAFVRVAMEFKWAYGTNYKGILKDVKNLSKMFEEGSKDHDDDLGDDIIRVNKGNKPNHAFLFIIDLTSDNNIIKKNHQYYTHLEEKYPVEVLWRFTNE